MNGTQENQKLESVQNVNQRTGIERKKPTQKLVKELFQYDDGDLIRRVAVGSRGKKGDSAGTTGNHGYLVTRINGRAYLNHRLVWLLFYGYLPEKDLDHRDRNKLNNRIDNLREVSEQCNMRNTGNYANNSSGVKGVSWHKTKGKWGAQIRINNKAFHFGYYDDFTEAVAYRLAAEQCACWSNCGSLSPAYKYMHTYLKEIK